METNRKLTGKIVVRPGVSNDLDACGSIFYEAFSSVNEQHNFPSEVPSPEDGKHLLEALFASGVHFLVAEMDGRVVGSNFIDERSQIAGVGPISVSPDVQSRGMGRVLMQAAIDRPRDHRLEGIRLMQASFNTRSLSLYAKLGFVVREPVAVMAGLPTTHRAVAGCTVRLAETADLLSANALCRKVYGSDRSLDLQAAIERGDGLIVEREGRLTGYASGFGYLSHAVGESTLDIEALLCAAERVDGTGIVIPTRNGELFRWCLENEMRVVIPYTSMTMGSYAPPQGAYIPSIMF